jgi:AraC family transcriptional regulator
MDEQARARHWLCSGGIRAALTHYPGGGRHGRHFHDHAQLSFLLAGTFAERLAGRDYAPCAMAVGNKPAGAPHDDRWGKEGALFFTLSFTGALRPLRSDPGWAPLGSPGLVRALVRAFLDAGDERARDEALCDLAALPAEAESASADPPRWLRRAYDEMREAPGAFSVAEAADRAGVHRVQLSRMFRRFYGLPPSLLRRRIRLARAVAALARGDSPVSEVALDTGFCDQAHLSNALSREIGIAPARLRRTFAAATSLQAP